ncbi:protein kinase subdomain-containing protein PKL/ccin3 [Coprinopsis cinerea AmutBmut pab1-1]|nr:protein kinase subdomain-containing protein PKL/ccin3 [Coprinopsis cinerea AmutBmut pab1-1]
MVFYEQLESLQDISIPDCFGFYSSTLAEQPHFPDLEYMPWTDRWHSFEDTDSDAPMYLDKYPSLDYLPDDIPYWVEEKKVHHPSFMLDSPWYKWDRGDAARTISVLVLELLGDDCTDRSGPATEKEVRALLEDIGAAGISHGNISPSNVLAFPSDSLGRAPQCPRHNVVHRWRIIDFDRSRRCDIRNLSAEGRGITTGDPSKQLALGGFGFPLRRKK